MENRILYSIYGRVYVATCGHPQYLLLSLHKHFDYFTQFLNSSVLGEKIGRAHV